MRKFVISVSYGNYLIQNGGTDKVIREHKEMFLEEEVDYVFLFPVIRTVFNKKLAYWGINFNNEFKGIYEIEGVLTFLNNIISNNAECVAFFIHHLWRVNIKELYQILDFIQCPIYTYLHDFYPICENKNLLDGDGEYCGYGLDSFECYKECKFYKKSLKNRAIFEKFLKRYCTRLTCVGPSQNTRDIYAKTFTEEEALFKVLEHQVGIGSYEKSVENERIKIAFIGAQNHIKGWDDYKLILDKFQSENLYDFYYFGTGEDHPTNIKVVNVSVREQGNDAMLKALRDNNIDIVLLLSRWPETYSYTYFEAYAAGCFIITYKCSGNIADMVEKNGNGIVLDKLEDVIEYIKQRKFREGYEQYSLNKKVPLELNPNNAIILKALKNKSKVLLPLDIKKNKKGLLSLIYRLQNRKKLLDI